MAASNASVATNSTKVPSTSILASPHFDPTAVNSADPFILFVIQASFIIILSRILNIGLHKIRQPRVVADVIAGILLGPSVFGRIPHFTAHIFPPLSLPYLNLVANIGLVLFLFLVGLEVDFKLLKRNAKSSLAISGVGMILPFGLGAAVSVGIYDRFINQSAVSFGHFLLFVGVAMAITAFPVLARILTELKLMNTDVGLTVLAAGVGNDVVGWILLALAVALVNAGSGVTAVYVLLCGVGWTLALVYLVRPLFHILARKSGSLENGAPTTGVMTVLVVLIFASAWITDVIGIHAIFGGFLVGVIMPHEGGFASGTNEKIEDLVSVLFLPLYFALSGLKTDLGLLSDGSIWGWTIAVIVVAFSGKFFGCALAARMTGFEWRESAAVGSLMSCKGLVELIVLNIGLNAGILNKQVFAMFVVMALVTTFATTPLTMAFYPVWYQQEMTEKRRAVKAGQHEPKPDELVTQKGAFRARFVVVLSRLDHLPSMMAFVKLLQPPITYDRAVSKGNALSMAAAKDEAEPLSPVDASYFGQLQSSYSVDALRLMELTERSSAVLKASELEETVKADPLSQIFTTFAGLNAIPLSTKTAIVASDSFPSTVTDFATERSSDMIIIPWNAAAPAVVVQETSSSYFNPFESLFGGKNQLSGTEASPQYANFVRNVFAETACDVGLYLDYGTAPAVAPAGKRHLFLAMHGGVDDRACLQLIVQLCSANPGVTATIVRIVRSDEATADDNELETKHSHTPTGSSGDSVRKPDMPVLLDQFTLGSSHVKDTMYGPASTHNQLQSETADELLLARYFSDSQDLDPFLRTGLQRVQYSVVKTARPLFTTLVKARQTAQASSTPILIVTGRSRRGGLSHREELSAVLKGHVEQHNGQVPSLGIAASPEVRKSLGDVASAIVGTKCPASLLLVQASLKHQQAREL
ncbi:uncharacterized protein L969DRAFT_44257 [Mixia osmundae IAM 14324]|uniref:Cation/H+ exchanger transmembrane domain-containing protein n=1 Tax=Mixia osmundae (strain CBS 9802 / IAM 14324 / JCM 22182 / KY 12970) TaxID=764103 RepID=G7E380_MIXOS|nr:uncharacterized protein L969DRAFT_44257 [Mixia osmundae IAM 14324]KEI42450.1 hypothetical protein L969DRAFT_44257 [Mixia osmundae IAM 14324]GAA97261.1 hypothetical protein E5Q_03938 [Mixia osmundae IAM 14324]